jgi:site-specific recombinase XerD
MTIYRRGKSKTFHMNFTVNGIRVCKSTGKQTKREAKAVEAAERHKLLKESKLSPQEKRAKTLLMDAVDLVYESKWKHGKDSQRSYRRGCNLVSLVGNVQIGDINEETVLKLIRKLQYRKSSIATINRYLACLKTVLKQMKQQTDFISLKKERQGRIRVMSKDEEKQLLSLLRDTEHAERRVYFQDVADLIVVLMDTGMRLSEGLNLSYRDIDFDSNMISIWINKSDRPRSVPMTKRARSILAIRQAANQVKPFALKAHQAETAWQWVRKEMGLEGDKEFVIHSATRHTCASRLVNAGVDLYVVKDILGHASIATTQIYAHLAPHKLVDAMSVLED